MRWRSLPAGRRPYVFTKSSLVWDEHRQVSHSLRADSIRREVEGSLQRLGVEVIDLYQIHWPRWGSSPAGWDPGPIEEGWQAMADLQKAGKVRYIGASNFTRDDLARAEAVAPVSRACSRPTRCSGARPRPICSRGVSSTAPA